MCLGGELERYVSFWGDRGMCVFGDMEVCFPLERLRYVVVVCLFG